MKEVQGYSEGLSTTVAKLICEEMIVKFKIALDASLNTLIKDMVSKKGDHIDQDA